MACLALWVQKARQKFGSEGLWLEDTSYFRLSPEPFMASEGFHILGHSVPQKFKLVQL